MSNGPAIAPRRRAMRSRLGRAWVPRGIVAISLSLYGIGTADDLDVPPSQCNTPFISAD
jgi:hypothetical protein